jgi:hypothetical protein
MLNSTPTDPAVIIDLGETHSNPNMHIFAIQIGFEGGSRYILAKGKAGPKVTHFDIIPIDCTAPPVPGVVLVRAGFYTLFKTSYCLATTVDGIRDLAISGMGCQDGGSLDWIKN